jgi:protein TonB
VEALHLPGPVDLRLAGALIASLAVHAAVLSVSPPEPRVALLEPPAVLEVVLREFAAPSAATPEPVSVVAPVSAREKRTQPAPRKREAPQVVREVESPPALAPIGTEDEPLRVAPAAPEPLATPAPPSQPSVALQAPLPRAPSSDLLSAYGHAISQILARHKEYPRIALMQGWQGAVTMRLRIAPTGRLLDAEVHTSSGYEALDRQALAMASKAEHLPPPPEGLRDRDVTVLVPVIFRLER